MPAYSDHQDIRPAYVMDSDPTLDVHNNIQPGILWIDTSGGAGAWQLYVRNDANTVWELLSSSGTGAPDTAHYVTTQSEAGLSAEVVLGTGVIMYGVVGSRPSASISGRLYYATDEDILYRDNSSTWDNLTLDWAQITGKPTLTPIGATYITGSADADLTSELVLGSAVIMAGIAGSRPSASLAGRLYYSTDTFVLERDTGAAWVIIKSTAANVVNVPAGTIAATDVQAAIDELNSDAVVDVAALAAHLGDAVDAHDASAISSVAAGDLVSTDVQAALNELDTEKAKAILSTLHYITTQTESDLSGEIVLGTGVIMYGVAGSRPAASIEGRLYYSTDTDTLERDNAVSWDNLTLDWGNVTGKPSSFIPVDHAHAASGDGGAVLTPVTFTSHGSTKIDGVITPTIASDQNNWNPTGLSTATVIRVTATGSARAITGLSGGADGRIIIIKNVGSFNVELWSGSGSSSAGNRFLFIGGDIVLVPDAVIALQYDATATKWNALVSSAVPIGAAGGALSGTYPNPSFAVDMATQAELDAVSAAKFITTQVESALSGEVVLGTSIIMYGLASGRPSASIAGRLYYSTDTDVLERDNSSSWDPLTLDYAQITGKPTLFAPALHDHDSSSSGHGGALTGAVVDTAMTFNSQGSAPSSPVNNSDETIYARHTGTGTISRLFMKDGTGAVWPINETQILTGFNNTGSNIVALRAVAITTTDTDSTVERFPNLVLAKADAVATGQAIGITYLQINNGGYGRICRTGLIANVDTSAWADGDKLYLSAATAGLLTTTPPATNPQLVAIVEVSHATLGKLIVVADGVIVPHTHINAAGGGDGGPIAASSIVNTPAGNIAATNVQTALNELDTEKVDLTLSRGLNPIRNGGFNLWRIASSFSAVPNGTTIADAWLWACIGVGLVTIDQETSLPTIAANAQKDNFGLRITVSTIDASIGAGDLYAPVHVMYGDAWKPYAQRQFTIGFWVHATVTGIHCISFRNSGLDRSYVAEYTINSANTWEYKTITVSASPSAGTWNYFDSGIGLYISWAMAAGSTYQTTANAWNTGNFAATANQVNDFATVNNHLTIWGVRMGLGPTVPYYESLPFAEEVIHIGNISIPVVFSSSDYQSNIGTWVVASGNVSEFRWNLVGKIMTVWFGVNTSTITGGPGYVSIRIPAGKTCAAGIHFVFLGLDGAGLFTGFGAIATSGTAILLFRDIFGTALTNTVNFYAFGQLSFEVV